ncbi:NUDIX hydrolase [Candidatus Dojkabacteria bacterium]|uniref:NUDIX hydrolase n=1 Tax=Candidatus Dojkabacteria bacterium TaxID=2099670 RepID=A0A955L8Y5_9BACT|nr:NUDIX hydrolase [Candidatus Dojkabacteria bacterium]
MSNFQSFHISVKGILVVKDEFLLLQDIWGATGRKTVDLPGGRVDTNEMIKNTLYRELLEEIGVDIKNVQCKIELFDYDQRVRYGIENYQVAELIHRVNLLESTKPKISLSEEHVDYFWVNPSTDLTEYEYTSEKQLLLFQKLQRELKNK